MNEEFGMTVVLELTDAQKLGQHVYHLITTGDKGAALVAAQRGWAGFPEVVLAETPSGPMTFEKLAVILSADLGVSAAPAEQEEQEESVPVAEPEFYRPASLGKKVPVPAVAPVSVAPAVMPVSPAPVAATSAIVIERTAADGTIIVTDKSMPKLKPLIGHLGWEWAKRGFLYLGDRDTTPNMVAINATVSVLSAAGLLVSSTVSGMEPARPVSPAPTARRRAAAPTRRQLAAQNSRVPVSAPPVSAPVAPVAPVFRQPVSVPAAAPVSAPAGAAGASPDVIAVMMQQMQAMQEQMAEILRGGAPAAVVAPVAPVSAVPVSPATMSLEASLAGLIDSKKAEQIAKVEALTWQFRVADGASNRHTARELRSELRSRVGDWWTHHHAGSVTFSVMVDTETPGVLHVKVSAAGGDVAATKLSEQVVGTALTVRGIWSRSTTKRDV